MRLGIDGPLFRRGLLIGLLYSLVTFAIGLAAGYTGTRLPDLQSIDVLFMFLLYGALGWWGAAAARSARDGAEKGTSIGAGAALVAWLFTIATFLLTANHEITGAKLPAFLLLTFLSTFKFAAAAALAGQFRGKRNDPAATLKPQ